VVVVGKEPRTQRALKKSDQVRNFPAMAKIRNGCAAACSTGDVKDSSRVPEVDLT
jgi:hypothetical protein